ncbi:hypothetical protein MIR68_002675 [Amoeboaphelidium protococcarum]|nr:hypothetical protein MIR68_002675 [Amoeboaphelidium protococcarum]
MRNISYALCGAHTVCWYVGPSLVSIFLFNHSLVLSRRLKQSRLAALLHLALSTAYSTVSAVLLRYLYAMWCLLVLHFKYMNASEPLVFSRSSSCCISILFLIKHACSSMLCSMSTVLTLLKLLHGSLKLCPSLLLSRTQFRVPLLPGAKSFQLTGADGSTQSATGFSIYDGVCWFVYHWLLAVGHGYQIGLVDISTSMISWTPLITCGITLELLVYVPTEVRPVTVGPLKGALCLIIYSISHGIVVGCTAHLDSAPTFGCTAHLGRFVSVSVSVSCLCSKYVPTEVRPVTVGPLKGALCLTTLIPRHCCWLYCTPGPCLDFWLYCTPGSFVSSLSLSPAFAPSMSQQRFVLLLLGR